MRYVLEKLSGKGVFHNTLMFAGRMLGKLVLPTLFCLLLITIFPTGLSAFAFFRVEGIAVQLLSALPTKQAMLSRFLVAVEQFSPLT